jgi:Zn-dependent protease
MLSDLTTSDLLAVIVSIIVGMTLHEVMHGLVAHRLGDDTAHLEGRLTLNPLAHIDLFSTVLLPIVMILIGAPPIFAAKPVPINPGRLKYDEFGGALVGVAGPLTNLVLAAVAALVLNSLGTNLSSYAYNVFRVFIEVNIAFFVFNMIPIPPLDGSRLLYAFAPEPLQEVMRAIEGMGFLILLVVFIFAFQLIAVPLFHVEQSIYTFLVR